MLIVPATVAPFPKEAALPGATKQSCRIVMLIDTGARYSVVTETVIAQLGIAPFGVTDVRTSLQSVQACPAYRVAIGLEFEDDYGESHIKSVPLRIIGSPPVTETVSREIHLRHDGLLGLDFLQHFKFAYDGSAGDFRLSW